MSRHSHVLCLFGANPTQMRHCEPAPLWGIVHADVVMTSVSIASLLAVHLDCCNPARAGVATAVEPKLRALQMQPGVRRHAQAREDARGDALLAMPQDMLVLDVNIVHAPAVAFLEGTVQWSQAHQQMWMARQRRSGEGQGGRVLPRHRWRRVRVGARGDGVWRQAWQGLHARAQQARDDRGRVRRGGEACVRAPRARGAQCSACARQRVCVEAGLQAMAYGGGRCFQTGLDRPTEEVG